MQSQSDLNQMLTWAIYHRDLNAVKGALAAGADVNLPYSSCSEDPVWVHHVKGSDYDVENRNVLNEIFELIVPLARNVTASNGFFSCLALSSPVLRLDNVDASSLVVLAAIKETKGEIKIDLHDIFSGVGAHPDDEIRVDTKQKILTVYARVAERLAQPVTSFEKEASAALSDKGREYWLQSLQFPDLADLPIPSQAFVAAASRFVAVNQQYGKLIDSHVTKSGVTPLSAGERIEASLLKLDSAEIEMDFYLMRIQGQIGTVVPRLKLGGTQNG